MDNKVSLNASALAKGVEVSGSVEGSAKKPEMPIQVEGMKLPLIYNDRLAAILHGFGLKASEENIGILRLLYENGLGLTKENFLKMNHALKLTGSSNKALFMYENNLKLSTANLAILDGIVSGKTKITLQLASLSEAINEMKDPELRVKLIEVFSREKEALDELLPKTQNMASQAGKQAATGDITPVSIEKLTAQAAAHHINIAYLGKFKPSNAENPAVIKSLENKTTTAAKEEAVTIKDAIPLPSLQLGETKASVVKHVRYESIAQEAKPQTQAEAANVQISPRTAESLNQPQSALAASNEVAVSEKVTASIATPNQSSVITQAQQSSQASGSPSFNNLLFGPAESNPPEISRYIESLRSRLVEIIQTLRDNPDPASNRIVQIAREILNHIDFSSQIRNQIYVQLPYAMGEGHTDVSLYVFKDASKSTASDGRGISSAFLSLETSSLGLFEAYVQKKDKSIHLQFRLKNDEIIDYVRENIAMLDTLLGDHDLSLNSYNFTKSDEAFTVLDMPEKLSEVGSASITAGDEIPQFDEFV